MNLSEQVLGLLAEREDWDTHEFLSLVANKEGLYLSVIGDAPYTARGAEEKARDEIFPMMQSLWKQWNISPERQVSLENVDWVEVAVDWNELAGIEEEDDEEFTPEPVSEPRSYGGGHASY